MTLDTPITNITNFGAKLAPKLKKLGLATARDLLFYFPYRWDDLSKVTPIKSLEAGFIQTVKGRIEFIENRRSWKKRMIITQAILDDGSGKISVIWFNQAFIGKNLTAGDEVYLSGKVEHSDSGLQFASPEYEKITPRSQGNTTHTARIVPRYSLTARVTQKQIRFLIKRALPLARNVGDWLPVNLIRQYSLFKLPQALEHIHFPKDNEHLTRAQNRLKFNELFLIQLHALFTKQSLSAFPAFPITFKEKETREFVHGLPFSLTNAQKKASWEIIKDIEKGRPMNRLLEGDVGSGKTVVSAIAILNVVLNGKQCAYMAPTEVLARQVYEKMCELLCPKGVRVALLTRSEHLVSSSHGTGRSQTSITKRDLLNTIKSGDIDLIIGTHALIQESVEFSNLAFTIIDEQHRFGVSQRKALRQKAWAYGHTPVQSTRGLTPHLLSMTATPVPRSLALTVYGDLDISIIDELPAGRHPIQTSVVPPHKRPATYQFIQNEIKKGRQVFVICPLIDPSDKLGVKSVTQEYKKLNEKIFPDLDIGLLHGRLTGKKKESVMSAFHNNKIQILVSTTVVEVGIDVPNASIMMIEGADRFGLAQLHQLRGRVGRGSHKSHCFLFTESENTDTLKRLRALVRSNNGFELAEADLAFRGPGEVYGVRQSGFVDRLKIAKLTDYPIIQKSRTAAAAILQEDPQLEKYKSLKNRLEEWEGEVHLE